MRSVLMDRFVLIHNTLNAFFICVAELSSFRVSLKDNGLGFKWVNGGREKGLTQCVTKISADVVVPPQSQKSS
jgi:hypothetical protein